MLEKVGSYEIREELGRGAMGVVYLARQSSLNRDVALKVLPPGLAADPSYVARFHREAEMASSLEHPAIITIYDTGVADGLHYIAMRYVRGVTLEAAARQRMPDIDAALGVCAQIADALAYAHGKGIIHRDLKPSNVLLTMDGRVALADFGIARAVASPQQTQAGQILGTPEYMAPEQIRGEPVDARTDLYSLGMILYFLLTGRPAFTGGNALSVLFRQAQEVPTPVRELNPAVSPAVAELVHRCLAKDPTSRYATARDFMGALEAARRGQAEAPAAEPTVLPGTGQAAAPGEMAALSLDMSRSTLIKEQRSEQVLATLFGDFRSLVNRCCQENGSLAHTWSGDGVVALFPSAGAAVRAATAVQRALPRFNRDHGQDGPRAIRARAGVDLGEVPWRPGEALGEVTSRTLDLAAKLQKAAQAGEVAVSWSAFSQLAERAGFLPGPRSGALAGAYCWTEWQEQQDVPPPEPAAEAPVSKQVSTQLQAALAMQSLAVPREGPGVWPRLLGGAIALAVLAAVIWLIAANLSKPVPVAHGGGESGRGSTAGTSGRPAPGGGGAAPGTARRGTGVRRAGVALELPAAGELTWTYLESLAGSPGGQRRVIETLTDAGAGGSAVGGAGRLTSTDPARPALLARRGREGVMVLGWLAPDGRTPMAALAPPYALYPNPLPVTTPLNQEYAYEGRRPDGTPLQGRGRLSLALGTSPTERTVAAGTFTAYPFRMMEEVTPAGGESERRERAGWFAPRAGIIEEEETITRGSQIQRLQRVLESKSF